MNMMMLPLLPAPIPLIISSEDDCASISVVGLRELGWEESDWRKKTPVKRANEGGLSGDGVIPRFRLECDGRKYLRGIIFEDQWSALSGPGCKPKKGEIGIPETCVMKFYTIEFRKPVYSANRMSVTVVFDIHGGQHGAWEACILNRVKNGWSLSGECEHGHQV